MTGATFWMTEALILSDPEELFFNLLIILEISFSVAGYVEKPRCVFFQNPCILAAKFSLSEVK